MNVTDEELSKYCKDLIKALEKSGYKLLHEENMVIKLPKMDCFENMNGFEVAKAIEDAGFKVEIIA